MKRRTPTLLGWAALAAATIAIGSSTPASAYDGFAVSLVSVTSSQQQVDDGPALTPSVSADGRFVVFSSTSATLVPDDTNGHADVFVRDTVARVTARVSVNCDGDQAIGGDSLRPSISPDGHWIVYESSATNLVGGDVNELSDIFVHDLTTGVTRRASVGVDGSQAVLGGATNASISGDGRFVAFVSAAPNLTVGDLNGVEDVFVRDTVDQVTTLVSAGPDGRAPDAASTEPDISDDGRFVAFTSAASLVAGDTDAVPDVFVRDLGAASTELVSTADGTAPLAGESGQPSVSADGNRVAFRTTGPVGADDIAGLPVVAVRDRAAGTTVLASVASGGAQSDAESGEPAISGTGRFVAFTSSATALVPGDTNGVADVFIRDVDGATTSIGSVAVGGARGDADSSRPALSSSGRFLVYSSAAGTLVPGDVNGIGDAFLADLLPPPGVPSAVTATPGDGQAVVAWTAPVGDPALPLSGYQVDAAPATGGGTAATCTTTAVGATPPPTTCTLTDLANGVEYTVRVSAVNASGPGTSSPPAFVTPGGVPAAPAGVTVLAGDRQLSVTWDAMPVSGGLPVTGFTVVATPEVGGNPQTCLAAGDAGRCDVTSLVNGASYTVNVVATNAVGSGPASPPVAGTPAAVPGAPDGLVLTLSAGVLSASWAPPAETGGLPILSYTVTATPVTAAPVTADPSPSCRVAGDVTACDVGALAPDVSYRVSVAAANQVGPGPGSAALTVTPAGVATTSPGASPSTPVGTGPSPVRPTVTSTTAPVTSSPTAPSVPSVTAPTEATTSSTSAPASSSAAGAAQPTP